MKIARSVGISSANCVAARWQNKEGAEGCQGLAKPVKTTESTTVQAVIGCVIDAKMALKMDVAILGQKGKVTRNG